MITYITSNVDGSRVHNNRAISTEAVPSRNGDHTLLEHGRPWYIHGM
jgi:hypothetical protein